MPAGLEGGTPYTLLPFDNEVPGVSGLEIVRRAGRLKHRRRAPNAGIEKPRVENASIKHLGCRLTSDAPGIIRTKPLGDLLILLARPVEMIGKPSNAPDRLSGFLFPDGVLQTRLVSEP